MENNKKIRRKIFILFSFIITLLYNVPEALPANFAGNANLSVSIKDRLFANQDMASITMQSDSLKPTEQKSTPKVEPQLPMDSVILCPIIPEPAVPNKPIEIDLTRENEPVGTPIGDMTVSDAGAAIYRLKIKTPNGGSLTPQISLCYNSQVGGYGLAGFGFDVIGISVITRGGKDLFHDGQVKGTTYTSSDTYFIDGKRLILISGTAGQDAAVYSLESDPFTTVTIHGTYNNSVANTWYEVKTSTGMTYQYGNSVNSKLTYKNNKGYARIASWYVNQATDRFGNYITYEYAISNYHVRPKSITYGTNSRKSRGIVNKIIFSYQSLGENARPFAIEDQQGKADVCISSITTTSNDSIYRKYTLSYNDSSDLSIGKWTRLVKVDEENGKGQKLPPIRFTWNYLTSPSVFSSQLDVPTKDGSSCVEETDQQYMSADLNGDGISDIVRVSPVKVTTEVGLGSIGYSYYTYVYVSRSQISSTGDISYIPPLVYCLPPGILMEDIKSMYGGTSVMDFDGDGYNDLVLPFRNAVTGRWNEVIFYILSGSDVATERSNTQSAFAINLQSTDKVPLIATFDVNGNGRDDIVCVEQQKKDNYYPCTIVQYVGGSELDHADVKLTLPQGVNKDIEKVFVGDYNNDGLSDLILLYNGGYKIYFNRGGIVLSSLFTENDTKSGTEFGDCWRIQQGDFDGDGLSDFVYNKQGESYLWIAHNNGNGTFTQTKAADIGISDNSSNKDDNKFSLMAYDIDHDGRTDVFVCKAEYKKKYTDTQVRWLYSTGSTLKLINSYTKKRADDAKESTLFLGDFDGDGNIELANYGSLLNSTNNTFNEKLNVYKSGYDFPQKGRIRDILDGMGNNIYIQYASVVSPTVYGKSVKNTYPVNTYTLPLPVVAKVTSDNGSIGSQETKYFYEDLRLHIAGKGVLGFNTITNENVTLGTKEVKSITRWDESLWIPTETKFLSYVGRDSSKVVSTYSISRADNNYFAYVSRKDATDMDGNKATTLANYDVSKGVVVDEKVMNDGDNMYKKVSYSGYQNKAGIWLPTTLTMTQKHCDDPVPYTTVTTYNYDDQGNVLSSIFNSGTEMALKTTMSYDVYGNILSSVTNGRDVKTIIKYNDYDTSGRFVIKRYTNPASAINTFTYDLWGNVLTESDATDSSNILTTKYTYDGWERKLTALQADGTQTSYKIGWGTSTNKKYYIKESTTGKPPVMIWYDKGGHETSRESLGVKSMPISKTITYNGKGLVSRVENKTGNLKITKNLAYDERGRIITDVLSSGKSTSYSYGNRSVTKTIDGRAYTKISDAWGNVVKSSDPVSEVEYQYSSIGKPSCVKTQSSTMIMTYDAAGNRLSLSDPDAGTSTYTYAADKTLLTQIDGRGIKTINNYDNLGRLISTQIGPKTIVYTYGTNGNDKLRLIKKSVDNNSMEYTHDKYGRIVTETRNLDGHGSYRFAYTYNNDNQLSKTTYPGGLEETYQYDSNGFKLQSAVGDNPIYNVESADGLVSSASFMGKLTATQTLNEQGYESSCQITSGSSVLENFEESYDCTTDNLLSRKRNNEVQEAFGYDDLDRLVSVKRGSTETMRINYAPNGNILFKTGVGSFTYDEDTRPHAVTEVENADGKISGDALTTFFNDYGKIQLIEDDGKNQRMDFVYGPDQERWYSELSHNGENVRTTIYAGEYEKITENGVTREFYYLDGNTIAVRENGVVKYYLAFTDNLGSILSVMDEDGTKVFDASYDAWGKQTVTLNTIGLHRGYTGHEMLSEFDIINMNGRLYDPILGRFFSPDNYVQMPDNSQNFNRYSYCLNNPLKYTDPSGELFGIDDAVLAFAVFNMASSMMQAAFEGNSVWKAGALSLLSSAASYGIGEISKGAAMTFDNELLRAGAHGLASGVVSALDGGNFLSSFASGAAASGIGSFAQCVNMNSGLMVTSTTVMGGAVARATGGDFLQGAMQGMMIGALNHTQHQETPHFSDKQLKQINDAYKEIVDIPADAVYEKIGGPLGEWAKKDEFSYSCAARVSYALNYGGMPIPKGTPDTYLGGDGKSYFINAEKMSKYFRTKWGNGIKISRAKAKNGIIFQFGFSSSSVSGHIDIVYRSKTYGHYYDVKTILWH